MNVNWVDRFFRYAKSQFSELELTRFVDNDGFSLVGQYPSKYKKRMGISKEVNVFPFLYFVFDINSEPVNEKYLNLTVSIQVTSRFDESDQARYMNNDSRIKHFKPVSLNTNEDFFINIDNGLVYEKKNTDFKKISLQEVYQRMLKAHLADVMTLKGLYVRFRIFFYRDILSSFFGIAAWFMGWGMYLIKKERYKYRVIEQRFLDRNQSKPLVDQSHIEEGGINFFGYKVRVWTLYTYSLFAMIIYFVWRHFLNSFFGNNEGSIFTLIFAIFSIITYDKVIPRVLELLIKHFSIYSYDLKYKSIKIKL